MVTDLHMSVWDAQTCLAPQKMCVSRLMMPAVYVFCTTVAIFDYDMLTGDHHFTGSVTYSSQPNGCGVVKSCESFPLALYS